MLDDIVLFLKIVELGSFRKAALFSNISSSAVSKRILHLEDKLGQRLMERDPKNIKLTEYGKFVYAKFENLLMFSARIDNLHNAKKNMEPNDSIADTVTVYMGATIGHGIVNQYLDSFMESNPEIKLNIIYQINASIKDNVIGDIILAVNNIELQGYKSKLISLEPIRLFCHRSYKDLNILPQHPNELIQHKLIGNLSEDNKEVNLIYMSHSLTKERLAVNLKWTRLKINYQWAMKEMALSANAIFSSWESMCRNEVRDGTIIRVLPEWDIYSTQIFITYKSNPTPAQKKVINFLAECCQYKQSFD